MSRTSFALLCCAFAAACQQDPTADTLQPQLSAGGLRPLSMPDEDPGPPFYARVGIQFLHDDGWIAIPFYRSPSCIPSDFNLLDFYHFPGPGGPGAFACPLLMTGTLLIEPDAPLGTFPQQAVFTGSGVPIWFVPSAAFNAAAQDGVVTIGDLAALNPLQGSADQYHETLNPRDSNHKLVIAANGQLADGRAFTFHVTEIGGEIKSIRIAFR